ncbi:BatD family protein, partial [Vulcaniibacterium tengchongense]
MRIAADRSAPVRARPLRTGLFRACLFLLLALPGLDALAQARAWLDRDRIHAGETVTLNVETAEAGAEPDYAPLQAGFELSARTSRREFELANGRARTRTLYAVALKPRRAGAIAVPALRVGGARTAPLLLTVEPAPAAAPARAGEDVFIESEADDADPYVQQAVGWVVRLYSAAPLVSGQLDQPAPEGATLQRVGDDVQYTREAAGRRYHVVERRFLLIPERSGTLAVPGARFEGRGTGGFFDDLFGDRGGELQAQAAPRTLQVRPIPQDAPQPWLPLQDLTLRYRAAPQGLRAGAAAGLTIELEADGATAAQLPAVELPPIDGAQVFADPPQVDERIVDGRPHAKLTRRFALVPARAGPVRLDGLRLPWWDVRAGAARTATLPPLRWQAAPAVSG